MLRARVEPVTCPWRPGEQRRGLAHRVGWCHPVGAEPVVACHGVAADRLGCLVKRALRGFGGGQPPRPVGMFSGRQVQRRIRRIPARLVYGDQVGVERNAIGEGPADSDRLDGDAGCVGGEGL